MKTIKQPDDWSCGVCCVQMLTGYTRKYILNLLDIDTIPPNDRKINTFKLFIILLSKGIIPGLEIEGETYFYMNDDGFLEIDIDFQGHPALLIVDNDLEDSDHMVLWSGSKIHDPSGCKFDFNEYKIKRIIPLMFATRELEEEVIERLK